MSVAPFILSRPTFTVFNNLINPVRSRRLGVPDDEPLLRGYANVIIPFVILLDNLMMEMEEGRSLGDDQAGIYESIERRLYTEFGIDGKACILRFICELQRRPISKWTVAGQLLTVLFTPDSGSKGKDFDLLKEYRAAQKLGLKEEVECESVYSSCPISVFHYVDVLQNGTFYNFF